MEQLLCHLFGDYVLQNQWMASNKTSRWWPACVHVGFYMLPFLLFLQPSLSAATVMAVTHLLIDRFRLARYWVQFWGIGCLGSVSTWLLVHVFSGHPWPRRADASVPDFLAFWLLIIVDNTFHLTINYVCLTRLT